MRGDGLSGDGPVTLYVQGKGSASYQHSHDDLAEALGWKRYAEEHGWKVQVYHADY